jgi:hypothetical protein
MKSVLFATGGNGPKKPPTMPTKSGDKKPVKKPAPK